MVVELKLFNSLSVAAILCRRNSGGDGKSTKDVMVFVRSLAMSHHSVLVISHISSLDCLVVTGATVKDD